MICPCTIRPLDEWKTQIAEVCRFDCAAVCEEAHSAELNILPGPCSCRLVRPIRKAERTRGFRAPHENCKTRPFLVDERSYLVTWEIVWATIQSRNSNPSRSVEAEQFRSLTYAGVPKWSKGLDRNLAGLGLGQDPLTHPLTIRMTTGEANQLVS